MIPTTTRIAPVITLLSPSPAASRHAQEILAEVFGLQQVASSSMSGGFDDSLNKQFNSRLIPKIKWDSVLSHCPASNAFVHWLSVDASSSDSGSGGFSFLGVTSSTGVVFSASNKGCMKETRDSLASHFPNNTLPLRLRHALKRPMTANALLKRHQGLPILDLPMDYVGKDDGNKESGANERSNVTMTTTTKASISTKSRWKEVAFTYEDDATYEHGETVLSQLSSSALDRPVTGLFQFDRNGLCVRPLPAARQDLRGNLRPVVLTFHCDNVEDKFDQSATTAIRERNYNRIGFTGHQRGQLRLQLQTGDILKGLDLRWCDATSPSSRFNESEEALLASSLSSLQSSNVLHHDKSIPAKDDPNVGTADCWMEVRTMVRNPKEFLKGRKTKVATAPPSYPE